MNKFYLPELENGKAVEQTVENAKLGVNVVVEYRKGTSMIPRGIRFEIRPGKYQLVNGVKLCEIHCCCENDYSFFLEVLPRKQPKRIAYWENFIESHLPEIITAYYGDNPKLFIKRVLAQGL